MSLASDLLKLASARSQAIATQKPKAAKKPTPTGLSGGKIWTGKQLATLTVMAGNATVTDISKATGKTTRALYSKASSLGISLRFKSKEYQFIGKGDRFKICGLYMQGLSSDQIAEKFEELTGIKVSADKVRSIIYRAGINNRRHSWTHDENIFILRNWKSGNQVSMSKFMNLSVPVLRSQYHRLIKNTEYAFKLVKEDYSEAFQRKINRSEFK